jgi:hypothetical protein
MPAYFVRKAIMAVVLLGIVGLPLLIQSSHGYMGATVTESAVTVSLIKRATVERCTAESNASGNYRFVDFQAGRSFEAICFLAE